MRSRNYQKPLPSLKKEIDHKNTLVSCTDKPFTKRLPIWINASHHQNTRTMETIKNIQNNFKLEELVCPRVYNKYRNRAWQFFDPRLLETLLFLRKKIGKAFYINNWHQGGNYSQRGLRCNTCEIVASKTEKDNVYVSAHIQGQAIDFDVEGMEAWEVRKYIIEELADQLPYPIRLENHVNWVHLDVRNANSKIYLFNP